MASFYGVFFAYKSPLYKLLALDFILDCYRILNQNEFKNEIKKIQRIINIKEKDSLIT